MRTEVEGTTTAVEMRGDGGDTMTAEDITTLGTVDLTQMEEMLVAAGAILMVRAGQVTRVARGRYVTTQGRESIVANVAEVATAVTTSMMQGAKSKS
mmetsp:Transcript_26300/g.55934  ORF Transcript_26300/g.55934 Transcript_26300/m.55934 type:complete len:97 (+) Transcript_26300:1135-1425(+)